MTQFRNRVIFAQSPKRVTLNSSWFPVRSSHLLPTTIYVCGRLLFVRENWQRYSNVATQRRRASILALEREA